MYANEYGNFVTFLVGSLSGILLIITFVKNFSLIEEVKYIGKHSLIYYSLHILILSTLTIVYNLFVNDQYLIKYQYYFGILNVIINLIILHFIAFLFDKYFNKKLNNISLSLKERRVKNEV